VLDGLRLERPVVVVSLRHAGWQGERHLDGGGGGWWLLHCDTFRVLGGVRSSSRGGRAPLALWAQAATPRTPAFSATGPSWTAGRASSCAARTGGVLCAPGGTSGTSARSSRHHGTCSAPCTRG